MEEQRRLDALARFAVKVERIRDLNPNQLELLALEPGLNEAELETALDQPPAPLPGGLPAQELRRDITERLAVVPGEYYIERITTVSYIFPGEPYKGVRRADGPAFLKPKSILGPSVVIVIAK